MSMTVLKASREGRSPGGKYARPPKDGPDSPLFAQGAPHRNMRIVLDETVGSSTGQDKLHLLLGLLTHPRIEVYRYADDGPPLDAPRRSKDWVGEVVPGWIELKDSPEALCDYYVTYADEKRVTKSGVFARQYMDLARGDRDSASYGDAPPDVAAEQWAADVSAVRVAAQSAPT